MAQRAADGSAGDANYGAIGSGYVAFRRPDPRIAHAIASALGGARTVLNVGAGTGSYEPADRLVTPVEPSATMRAQRPADLAPAIDAVAERLPFADRSFDAAMSTFSVHQWSDPAAGLAEMRRVTRGPIVIMSCDPDELDRFWLASWCPEVIAVEAQRYPTLARLVDGLGGRADVRPVPIPLDCRDGFNEAYYGRPEMLLNPAARQACSAWSFVAAERIAAFEATLAADLDAGRWDAAHGALRRQPFFHGSLKLIVGQPP